MCSPDNYTDSFEDVENDNYTALLLPDTEPISREQILYHQISYVSRHFLLPVIFGCGIIGNTLNIFIFTRRKFRHTLDDIEKSATTGLVALALSDFFFCFFGFPEAFIALGLSGNSDSTLEVIALYYKCYKQTLMNIFLFSSTWLVVVISIERYVAVVYPLRARWMVRVKRTIIIDTMVYVISGLFNIPGFLKYQVVKLHSPCANGTVTYALQLTYIYASSSFIKRFYQILWTVFGTFLPLAILTICNIRLLVEVYKSRQRYSADQRRYSTSKITFILIAVILLYLVLVCPSMLLAFFSSIVDGNDSAYLYRYRIAVKITNVAQALNFATNFLLYCVISKPFRENLRNQLSNCGGSRTNSTINNSIATSQRYYVVDCNNGMTLG